MLLVARMAVLQAEQNKIPNNILESAKSRSKTAHHAVDQLAPVDNPPVAG
jgi:hypothetical protein